MLPDAVQKELVKPEHFQGAAFNCKALASADGSNNIMRLTTPLKSSDTVDLSERRMFLGMLFLIWAMVISLRLVYLTIPVIGGFIDNHGGQSLIAACVITLGFLAYEFKKKDQLSYGRLEICFGISSAITLSFSILPSEMRLSQWATLVGCVYVIARGVNNVNDGKHKVNVSSVSAAAGQ